jgi:bifunctional non-homologous end joining protein LigD
MAETLNTTLDGHQIGLSNLEKVLFPKDGITKGDLIRYYLKIAPVMLPHLKDRPLSFQRFPDGIGAEGFYQKQVPKSYPVWIKRVPLGVNEIVEYALADTSAALVYFAQQAVIVFHTSPARADKPHNPDILIIDLDPQTDLFEPVRQTAFGLKELFGGLGLECFVKTTGSRGLHVAVPLDRAADFDQAHEFAQRVAQLYERRHPDEVTTEISKAKRGSRVFIDTNRNHYSQTAVAPYSVRARAGAPVAAPITWEELADKGVRSDSYSIENVFELLERRPDPWRDIYRRGQSLDKAEERLEKLDSR